MWIPKDWVNTPYAIVSWVRCPFSSFKIIHVLIFIIMYSNLSCVDTGLKCTDSKVEYRYRKWKSISGQWNHNYSILRMKGHEQKKKDMNKDLKSDQFIYLHCCWSIFDTIRSWGQPNKKTSLNRHQDVN